MSPDDALEAARRLAHDVGKYVRWSAPDEPEEDVEELRARLARDLGETRKSAGGSQSVLEVYSAWRAESGGPLAADPAWRVYLQPVEEALGRIAGLLPSLAALAPTDLRALDEASRELARRCTALLRAAREGTTG